MTGIGLYLIKKFAEIMIILAIVGSVIEIKRLAESEPEALKMEDYDKFITCGDITTDENEIRKFVNKFAREKRELQHKEYEINLYRVAFYLKDLKWQIVATKIEKDKEKYILSYGMDRIAEAESEDALKGAVKLLRNAYNAPIKNYVFRLKIIENDLGVKWMEI